MGYSHYWTTEPKTTNEVWDKFLKGTECILNNTKFIIKGSDCSGKPLLNDETVMLNGDARNDEDFESFVIVRGGGTWEFCKTAKRPYDEVVVACLMLANSLGILTWSSDGDPDEHEDGKKLFEKCSLK